ncbi:MAG: 30S ribosomal protein S9 [Candidatus Doudnabacteria bacterium RIFCSPLOWO2_02_FULL_48_8]|uniref:Small ribosomal subunit protein uS9 n=1 Tax=Candidatus Doudnabacteria bacterium RIFCSPHIGHO2_01_FULL_46_24 TaxID=1817825 RepID=A0A1F5NUA5_9BACT|nr:MAG: 30S ribosomal protein S9 [Candidatus Doudnabacteria bacterium RIFCSPHIGHO2_01_FULL_46_24]OGE94938.1 MAG: 30S ribosomal protein S9 [Candidatus Doudnabacteria bacterium RIFCSPLOWO2_02_FULL_48_8]
MAPGKHFHAVGRRKTAVTQVLLSGGNGTITVNELPFEKYFATEDLRVIVQQPLNAVGILKSINVRSKIHGGGIHAQAESMRHAIARAIIAMNPESRRLLKKHGFLTRDPRVKERKKPGLKRARRAPQFSKR